MAESIEDSDILLMPSMSHLKSGLMVDGHDGTDERLCKHAYIHTYIHQYIDT